MDTWNVSLRCSVCLRDANRKYGRQRKTQARGWNGTMLFALFGGSFVPNIACNFFFCNLILFSYSGMLKNVTCMSWLINFRVCLLLILPCIKNHRVRPVQQPCLLRMPILQRILIWWMLLECMHHNLLLQLVWCHTPATQSAIIPIQWLKATCITHNQDHNQCHNLFHNQDHREVSHLRSSQCVCFFKIDFLEVFF